MRILMMMLLCALVARTPIAAAQDTGISIDAELSRTRAYLGDTVSYQVSVRGIKDGTEPSIAFPEGVVVEYRGVSSQQFTTMRSINGRQRAHTDSSYRHNYLLTVVQEGELVIPPAVLNINNQEYRSNSVRLSAMLPAEHTLSLHDALPISLSLRCFRIQCGLFRCLHRVDLVRRFRCRSLDNGFPRLRRMGFIRGLRGRGFALM